MAVPNPPAANAARDPYRQPRPQRRPLKIYAFDPMLGRAAENRISISIRNEPRLLERGPRGERIEVIDYDPHNDCYYEPVDLEDASLAMQGGLDPSSSDPRFHQQMVYAVASHVLENFDHALGRRIRFRKNRRLRIFPHAFLGANAFYDPGMCALLFGYFRADAVDPGPNMPGQMVFTCLSQDIVAHEMTHALVDRLRRRFLEPSNQDVAAFHEGFSDIVAIFQHFSFPGILRDMIQRTRGDLRSPSPLVELAAQFGHSRGMKAALRTAVLRPDASMYKHVLEPHARGSILVAAVFDAFFSTYQRRIADLIRIATGGTGRLPEGDLHPDLVARIANEASKTAQQILTMCIRAFDYLPPVDINFGDFLRALVTADFELAPADDYGLRASMIEAFRARGIYARGTSSLAEEALLWERGSGLKPFPVGLLSELVGGAQEISPITDPRRPVDPDASEEVSSDLPSLQAARDVDADVEDRLATQLHAYAKQNAAALLLDNKKKIALEGFHASYRVAADGSLKIELVAQFSQSETDSKNEFGGILFRGGTTVVAGADGGVRYVIPKPLEKERRVRQSEYVTSCDARDSMFPWLGPSELARRHAVRLSFSALHVEGG